MQIAGDPFGLGEEYRGHPGWKESYFQRERLVVQPELVGAVAGADRQQMDQVVVAVAAGSVAGRLGEGTS